MSSKLDRLVLEQVMGIPCPPPRTYAEAERLNHSNASCFRATAFGWVADVDWGEVERHKLHNEPVEWRPEHEYSSDISAAWQIIEHWGVLPYSIDNCWRMENDRRVSGHTCTMTGHKFTGSATTDSVERSICLAALRACGVPEAEIQEAMTP